MEEKRKTVTSTEVKRRYNQKVYSQISFSAPKELVEEFRGICRNIGISQASVFKKFILCRNGKHGSPLFDKRYGAVLKLTGSIGLRMNIRYFLEL